MNSSKIYPDITFAKVNNFPSSRTEQIADFIIDILFRFFNKWKMCIRERERKMKVKGLYIILWRQKKIQRMLYQRNISLYHLINPVECTTGALLW